MDKEYRVVYWFDISESVYEYSRYKDELLVRASNISEAEELAQKVLLSRVRTSIDAAGFNFGYGDRVLTRDGWKWGSNEV